MLEIDVSLLRGLSGHSLPGRVACVTVLGWKVLSATSTIYYSGT